MRQTKTLIALLFLSLQVQAQSPSALSYDINVQESIIENGGIKYRKVEYKGDVFYLRLLESESNANNAEIFCSDKSFKNAPNQILISSQITKRSFLFIEGLQKTCTEIGNGQKKVEIDSNIKIGFGISDYSKQSVLKNRKLYWQPKGNLFGASAEF